MKKGLYYFKNVGEKMRKGINIFVIKLNKKILILLAFIILLILMVYFLKGSMVSDIFSHKSPNKIVIDPGHGGIDGGTGDKDGLLEKDINLDVSLKLKKVLEKEGFKVVMTREKDVSLEEHSDIKASRYIKDLNARKTIINENDPIVFVSVHVNSSKKSTARGVKVYYYPTSTEGKMLAQSICQSVDINVYQDFLKDNSMKAEAIPEDYFVLRETKYTGVLVEVGFITNIEDNKLIKNNRYQQKIALAIKEGIKEYIE
ncbi:N-acetylmuramoyl-L-alanine amidase [Tissierella sp. MSJ-40]|uniref:N-acetylmuramoyl-L-alanine amidase n=1 Tax=Tissierella simiarum TaxID=2841534 RepID=A0ABS6E2X1_9FIRM|nr:N-acetylmuramoyl-L-alanine amidase [Tissierella simiarum]MBU5437134.1 N-acetylmuramoyl-L-alanine amidase [Tissierella simiarum]